MATVVAPVETLYDLQAKKGEGTFSEVVKAHRKVDGTPCAIKRMKGKFSSAEQVDNLREVQCLRRLNPHPNVIDMIEVIYDSEKRTLDLVFELMDMNIYERIKGRRHHLPEDLVKSYMYQLLKALDHMHRNGIFHRDIKPENVLISDTTLKLADFGSCRGIYSKPPFTEYISTRWYRAPECLLTNGFYGYKMDMWSVGCVMFEVMSLYPLFPGSNELDQINKIHEVLGTPEAHILTKIRKQSTHMNMKFPDKAGKGLAKLMPRASKELLELLTGLLEYDPDARMSARQALRHPFFKELRDADKRRNKAAKEAQGDAEDDEVSADGAHDGTEELRTKTEQLAIGRKHTRKAEKDPSKKKPRSLTQSIAKRFTSRKATNGVSVIAGHPVQHQTSTKAKTAYHRNARSLGGPKLPPLAVAGAGSKNASFSHSRTAALPAFKGSFK